MGDLTAVILGISKEAESVIPQNQPASKRKVYILPSQDGSKEKYRSLAPMYQANVPKMFFK